MTRRANYRRLLYFSTQSQDSRQFLLQQLVDDAHAGDETADEAIQEIYSTYKDAELNGHASETDPMPELIVEYLKTPRGKRPG
jgi:hypothetical protein